LALGLKNLNGPEVKKLDPWKADRIADLEGVIIFRDGTA